MRQQCECRFYRDDGIVSNQRSTRTLSGREVLKFKSVIHKQISAILQHELHIYIYHLILVGLSNSELTAPHNPSLYFLFLLKII